MTIPFNIKKYNTGKYDVVTRHKHKAIIEATEPELIARIPTQPDCRGMFRYCEFFALFYYKGNHTFLKI